MSCQKSPPFPEHSLHFFSLSQSVFVLAHWRNTSFHASQQQCYPLRCEKGETGENERDFPYRFLPGSACCKSCGHPKVCNSPCPRQPDRRHCSPQEQPRKVLAFRLSRLWDLAGMSQPVAVWHQTFLLCDPAHQTDCSADTKDQAGSALLTV